ncbi:MAG TPA: carboxypeptidase-like regulatory domain-containing protein [Bacteroidetes bacterium]|nr:carboxypeptidase-like regulatory domain-containing protein [Bacteroidota bacterium]
MKFLKSKNHLFLSLLFSCFSIAAISQKTTSVKGQVIDADTEEPLLVADVHFAGTNIGTSTDFDGYFELESKEASDSIEVSYVGYETQTIAIQKGAKQELNVALLPVSVNLGGLGIVVEAKGRVKYKNDNPAVRLIQNVIKHKADNRISAMDYYEYDKYEKVEFDLNNFDPEKMRKKRAFKKFQFLFDYVDTSELNGKPYLPFYIQETSSKVYYRKKPKAEKEFRQGVNILGMEDYVNVEDFSTMMDVLYQDIDIYDNNIKLLDIPFLSPLNPASKNLYRFYIADTAAVVNGNTCIKLTMFPKNNQEHIFKGDLYILKDSSYAVIKADLGVDRHINLNFVQDLKLVQEFTQKDGVWVLSKDKLVLDFAITKKGTGIFGKREVSYKDFVFGKKREDDKYAGTEQVVAVDDAYKKGEDFWKSARHDTLSKQEQGVFQMIDTLQKTPAFKTIKTIIELAFTGYKAFGPVDIGPIGNFYSYNPVEGTRLKFGGETNLKFHPKLLFAGYTAYGLKDQEWKYGASVLYSFKENFKENPKHFFRLSYQHELKLIGQDLKFSSADNFLLSFQRGSRDKYLFYDKYKAEYFLELDNNLSWDFSYTNTDQLAYGGTILKFTDETGETDFLPGIRTSELGLTLRFAPNEQYLQGRSYRVPIFNKFPVFKLILNAGIKDMLGGDYNYGSASLNIFKRFYLSLLGSSRFEIEGGKYWGKGVPYFLLNLPKANQSFAYRTGSFNMMNYQEFVNDAYVSVSYEHYFNGFFFNRIPLFRKLKLREVATFKAIYGQLSDKNNPNKNPALIQFVEENGVPITYTLEEKPYMEASVGVMNIFKFGRIDFLRRLNYLDNRDLPNLFGVKGLGIRGKLQFSF